MKVSKQTTTILRITVSVALLLALVWMCSKETGSGAGIWQTMRDAAPLPLAGAFALYLASMLVAAYRWRILLRTQGIEAGVWRLTRYYLIGSFFNNFLPSSVGGDVVRVLALTTRGCSAPVSFASVFVERLIGFLAIALLSIASLLLLWHELDSALVLVITFGLGAAFAGVTWCAFNRRAAGLIMGLCARLRWRGIGDMICRVYDAVHVYRGHRGALWQVFAISLAYQFILGVSTYLVAIATGLQVGFWMMFALMQITAMAGVVPITLETAGVREGIYVLVLGAQGISKSVTLGTMLLVRLVAVIGSSLGGLCLLFGEQKDRTLLPRVAHTPGT